MTSPTALYRAHDAEGRLLYVGISDDPLSRFGQHSRSAPWAHKVRALSIEWHADRATADAAETAAIRSEDPIYNLSKRPILRYARWMLALDRGCHADDIAPAEAWAVLHEAFPTAVPAHMTGESAA
jgi:predicted GIY-YIG superfamily endonuclease